MPANTETAELISGSPKTPPSGSAKVNLNELIHLAVQGLPPMFDAEKQEFCHRLVRTPSGLVREGLSPRYTAMTVLGLNELEKYQGRTPFATDAILNKLLERQDWPEGAGDFGVLLWMTAARAPEKLPALLARLDLKNSLERYPDMRQKRTMELAWFLTGLSCAALAKQPGVPDLTAIATNVYTELIRNQGEGGFFGHLGSSSSGAGRVRGWLGSFADQVYPTIALTRFSQAFSAPGALEQALQCGLGICRVQGPLGQWWWHYDSRTGKVASMYPVFSVHQEAMGPMALFPLGEATGRDFREHIYRGLQWIGGSNEMGVDMREGNLVWRRIHPIPERTMKMDVAMSHLRLYRDASHRKMDILHECRPYELGWLLYAFAAHANDAGI